LVSAKLAIVNTRKPTNCGMKYHMPPWAWTIAVSESEPAVMITPINASPCETSYEISWAAARIAPRKEYFEPEAQPPSISP
jgi:hypothetical protein